MQSTNAAWRGVQHRQLVIQEPGAITAQYGGFPRNRREESFRIRDPEIADPEPEGHGDEDPDRQKTVEQKHFLALELI